MAVLHDALTIYPERLREGAVEKLDIHCSPAFIEVNDTDQRFESPVHIEGEAYEAASGTVIVQATIATEAQMPCRICNEWTSWPIKVTTTLVIEAPKKGAYSIQDWVREEILLNTPFLVECGGNCPHRKQKS